MHTLLNILLVIFAVTAIVSIMLQPSKSDGLSGLVSGGSGENYFSKNKTKTYETMLARITVVSFVLFAIVVIALNLIK